MPRVLHLVVKTRIREVFLIATLFICLGMALLMSSLGLVSGTGRIPGRHPDRRIRIQPSGRIRHPAFQGRFQQPFFISVGMPARRGSGLEVQVDRARPGGRHPTSQILSGRPDRPPVSGLDPRIAVLTGLALARDWGVLLRPGRCRAGQRVPGRGHLPGLHRLLHLDHSGDAVPHPGLAGPGGPTAPAPSAGKRGSSRTPAKPGCDLGGPCHHRRLRPQRATTSPMSSRRPVSPM